MMGVIHDLRGDSVERHNDINSVNNVKYTIKLMIDNEM